MPDVVRPPIDRPLALACHLRNFRDHWLKLRCCGGTTLLPLRMIEDDDHRTLADVVLRLRCRTCGAPPGRVVLIESPQAPPEAYGAPLGWELPLVPG